MAAATSLIAASSSAASYPEKPVRLVVAFPAGSGTDSVARIIGEKLTDELHQPFVVENRPGAGGNIGTVAVSKGAADGYTVLVHSVAFSVNPSLYKSVGYDPLVDFTPIAIGATTANILYVNPSVTARNLAELIELARAQRLSYASSGTGTTTHLGPELLFRKLAKVDVTHVPFSPAEAATAVVGGTVPIASTSLPPAIQFIKSGRARAIAVTSAQRNPALPDVPTVAESGYPGFEALTWFGFFVPGATPPGVSQTLNAAISRVVLLPEVTSQLAAAGLTAQPMTLSDMKGFVGSEVTKWAAVIEDSGATAD